MATDWRKELTERWGIALLGEHDAAHGALLWVTRCSRTKRCRKGLPTAMYVSPLNLYFYRFAVSRGVRFGVISDKYGLHMDDERLAYYDVHPSQLSTSRKKILGGMVGQKARAAGYSTIVFYNNSPKMSRPYFEILSYSGLKVLYTTRLPR